MFYYISHVAGLSVAFKCSSVCRAYASYFLLWIVDAAAADRVMCLEFQWGEGVGLFEFFEYKVSILKRFVIQLFLYFRLKALEMFSFGDF